MLLFEMTQLHPVDERGCDLLHHGENLRGPADAEISMRALGAGEDDIGDDLRIVDRRRVLRLGGQVVHRVLRIRCVDGCRLNERNYDRRFVLFELDAE